MEITPSPPLWRLAPNSVALNLSPGVVDCLQVLEALVAAVPLEHAAVMEYAREGPHRLETDPPIWADFARALNPTEPGQTSASPIELERVERFEFYRQAAGGDVALTIATGEQRIYANLLLRIGVVMPEAPWGGE